MKISHLKRPIVYLLICIVFLQTILLVFVWMAPNVNYTVKLQAMLDQSGRVEFQHDLKVRWRSQHAQSLRSRFKGHPKMKFGKNDAESLTERMPDIMSPGINFTNGKYEVEIV